MVLMVKMTLRIDGMACGMCEAHINDAIRRAVPVKKVSSSHSRGTTEIIAQTAPDEAAVRRAVEAGGYRVLSGQTEPYEKKRFSLFQK